jgi:hypothetical protein
MKILSGPRRYRFAITGAQASGKTTLAKALAERCCCELDPNCVLLSGIGAEVGRRGYSLGSGATTDTFLMFATAHVRRERECVAMLTIQDRCLVDLLAYARVRNCLSPAGLELLLELAVSSCSALDCLFYTPISDATRHLVRPSENTDFRLAIAREIEYVSDELSIPLLELSGTPEERLDAALVVVHRIVS